MTNQLNAHIQGSQGFNATMRRAGYFFDGQTNNTSHVLLPSGTTNQRPTAAAGMLRYNSTTATPEFYFASAWLTPTVVASGTSLTTGSVVFASSGALTQSNSNLFFDTASSNFNLGVGVIPSTAYAGLTTSGKKSIVIGNGTEPATGTIASSVSLYSISSKFKFYEGAASYFVMGTATRPTLGSVLVSATNGFVTEDNANFFFDTTTHNLAIGTTSVGNGAKNLVIGDGTVPSGTLTATVALYAASGKLKFYQGSSALFAVGSDATIGGSGATMTNGYINVNIGGTAYKLMTTA